MFLFFGYPNNPLHLRNHFTDNPGIFDASLLKEAFGSLSSKEVSLISRNSWNDIIAFPSGWILNSKGL